MKQTAYNHTQSSVSWELLVDLFHPLNIQTACLCMIYHWFGIINPYNAFCSLLDTLWGIPRIIDVFCRETSKYWQITPWKHKISRGHVKESSGFLLKEHSVIAAGFGLRLTWYNPHLGQFFCQNPLDSSSEKTAERRNCRTATSSFQHSHSSLHQVRVLQRP